MRLERHEGFIADIEKSLEAEPLTCSLPDEPEALNSYSDAEIPTLSRMQMDNAYHALSCGLTRSAVIQYSAAQGGPNLVGADMAWFRNAHPDINFDVAKGGTSASSGTAVHGFSHIGGEGNHAPNVVTQGHNIMAAYHRWHMKEIAGLAERLRTTPEQDGVGNMLDNTLIVWCSEVGQGWNHDREGMPFVLIGNVAGALKTQQHLRAENGTSHGRLLLTLGRAVTGDPSFTMGDPDFCDGVLPGLLA